MPLEVRWDISGLDLDGAVEKGLEAGADHLLEEANRKVPIETGDLARSGNIAVDGAAGEAAVGYNSVYAARQHEELTWQHDAGREAKWLENAMNNNKKSIAQAIADGIKDQLT